MKKLLITATIIILISSEKTIAAISSPIDTELAKVQEFYIAEKTLYIGLTQIAILPIGISAGVNIFKKILSSCC